MNSEAKSALQVSIREFNDISGITWNKQTGNIVTGHHRWENLLEAYGLDGLHFVPISGTDDRFSIFTGSNEDTTFILRVVDWEPIKEKAANIAANSVSIAGTFTADLATLLSEIQGDLDPSLYDGLRFDELQAADMGMDFSVDGDMTPANKNSDEWASNIGKIDKIDSGDREMFDVIQVVVKKGLGDQLREVISQAIEGYDAKIR